METDVKRTFCGVKEFLKMTNRSIFCNNTNMQDFEAGIAAAHSRVTRQALGFSDQHTDNRARVKTLVYIWFK